MTTAWSDHPERYREVEIRRILRATTAGDCVAVVGLSGAGKSNLLGFMANRSATPGQRLVLIDCNQLTNPDRAGLFGAIALALGAAPAAEDGDPFEAARAAVQTALGKADTLVLLLDRIDALPVFDAEPTLEGRAILSSLRALRDRFKFKLTLVTASRHVLPKDNELAELFFANTLWLGPLNDADARWNIARFAQRRSEHWNAEVTQAILTVSAGYPGFLKAACEAVAAGCAPGELASHEAMRARVDEFWRDAPSADELSRSGLAALPVLLRDRLSAFDTSTLTAKEHLLLKYLQAHPNQVCEKDELIRAVWSEDKAFVKGIRDDSLAQLVRRLREKIEADPSNPKHIFAVPGRGYRFATS